MPRMLTHMIHAPVEIQTGPGYIVAVFTLQGESTIGIRFESPEQLLDFCVLVIEKAAQTWPNHPAMQEYLSE